MSYQVLARKWRSKTFAQVVGQEHVVRALTNALKTGRLHHAYLFTGTRGVGKTSLARILAKSLNCETGVTDTPCGQCNACKQIEGGRFVDLLEIDAASNTGIDNIREVLENAQYAPTAGRFKVYIIDEVHMLSKSAFNAMLKTLEEPPAHVKFVLATTDPQKVPVTILSRCLQFNLKQIPPQVVAEHLRHVLEQEQVPFEPASLLQLGQAAQGSMRDALSLLDQAIAYGLGQVTADGVRGMLGTVDQGYLLRLIEALADQDGGALMGQAEDMSARSVNFDNALQSLALLLHQVALYQTVPVAVDPSTPYYDEIRSLSSRLTPGDVQLFYQIALNGRKDLALAPDEFAGFSMTLLRMLAFGPGTQLPGGGGEGASRTYPSAAPANKPAANPIAAPVAQPAEQPVALAPQPAAPVERSAPEAAGMTPPWEEPAVAAAPEQTAPPAPAEMVEVAEPAMPPQVPVVVEAPQIDMMPEVAPEPSAAAAFETPKAAELPAQNIQPEEVAPSPLETVSAPAASGQDIAAAAGDWPSVVAALGLTGMANMFAKHCVLKQVDGDDWYLTISAQYQTMLAQQDKLLEALREHLGRPVRLHVKLGDTQDAAPIALEQKARSEELAAATDALLNDPVILYLQEHAGARLVPDSVKPLNGSAGQAA